MLSSQQQEITEETRELNLTWWQNALLQDTVSDVIGVSAGYGSGKTFGSALWTVDRLAINPGCDMLFIEPRWQDIKRIAVPAFEECFAMLGYTPNDYSISLANDNPHVKLPTRQKVYFITGENPKSIVGITTACGAVIDEAGLMQEEVFTKTRSRLRNKNAKLIQILCTGTAEGMGNFFEQKFNSEIQPGWQAGPTGNDKDRVIQRNVTMPGGAVRGQLYRHFRATVFANRANLADGYIENMLDTWGHNQNYVDSYLYGYFRPFATGLAYQAFKSRLHKIEDIEAHPSKAIHMTWDFNICPQWVVLQKQSDYGRGYWAAIDNANHGGERIAEALAEFKHKFPVETFRNTPIILYGDSSGHAASHKVDLTDYQQIAKLLRQIGYRNIAESAIKSNPRERVSVDLVNEQFDKQNLFICEKCDRVLTSLTNTTWDKGAKQKLHKPPGETWTHPMDAIKYFLCAIIGVSGKTLAGGRL